MPLAHLSERRVLKLSGADTHAFLQGQITSDMGALTPAAPLYAGMLSPQGKALFAMFLYQADDAVLIDCAADQAEALARRLAMYRLRRAVSIEPTELAVFASWGVASTQPADPRTALAGARWIGDADSAQPDAGLGAWHAHRLPLGLPEADEIGSDDLLWLETNARELNGVSFTKGCYTGQENTARMHHRDKLRKRLLPVRVAADGPLMAGEREAGTWRGERHGELRIALFRMELGEAALLAGGTAAELIQPAWLPKADAISGEQ